MKDTERQKFSSHSAMHWFWVVCALLSLLRSPLVSGASNFHLRNHTGLLFLYGFGEGQLSTTAPSETRDLSGLNLLGNLTTSTSGDVTWSALRQGITIPGSSGGVRGVSQLPSGNVIDRLQTEYSIEFIISSPLNPLSQSLLIGGFGNWQPGEPFLRCSTNPSEGGWRISSFLGAVIEVEQVVMIADVPTCISTAFSIEVGIPRHVVVRVRHGVISVVSHNRHAESFNDDLRFAPSLWSDGAFFSIASPHFSNGWTGSIFLAAMYNRFLSDSEIGANEISGLPNSLPTTLSAISISEDTIAVLYP